MTPAEKRYWERFHRRTADLEREARDALLRAYAILRLSLSITELLRLIESRNIQRLLSDVLSDEVLDRALITFRKRIVDTTARGFALTTPDLPRAGKIGGVLAVHFDPLDPTVIAAVQTLDTEIVAKVKQEVRAAVVAHVETGLRAEVPPRTIAHAVPSAIGLGPVQVEQVAGFRATLAGEPGHRITDYTLRDTRVDELLAKGPLAPAQIDRATEQYRTERVAGNVAAVGSKTARQSYRTGQALAWRSAKKAGVVADGEQIWKTWLQVDRPSKRLSHAKMHGETVPFESLYSNSQMVPGEDPEEYGCACVSLIRVRRAGQLVAPPA